MIENKTGFMGRIGREMDKVNNFAWNFTASSPKRVV
jgi:hypothetical protein